MQRQLTRAVAIRPLVVREAVRLKKDSYQAWSASGYLKTADRYRQPKWAAALVVSEAKTQEWEKFGEAMEIDFRSAPRRFWQTVRPLKQEKQCLKTLYIVGVGCC